MVRVIERQDRGKNCPAANRCLAGPSGMQFLWHVIGMPIRRGIWEREGFLGLLENTKDNLKNTKDLPHLANLKNPAK